MKIIETEVKYLIPNAIPAELVACDKMHKEMFAYLEK